MNLSFQKSVSLLFVGLLRNRLSDLEAAVVEEAVEAVEATPTPAVNVVEWCITQRK